MEWFHHERSVQTMFYTLALERLLNEYVGGILYEGLGEGVLVSKPLPRPRGRASCYSSRPSATDGATVSRFAPAYTATKGYKKVALSSSDPRHPGLHELHRAEKSCSSASPPVKPDARRSWKRFPAARQLLALRRNSPAYWRTPSCD